MPPSICLCYVHMVYRAGPVCLPRALSVCVGDLISRYVNGLWHDDESIVRTRTSTYRGCVHTHSSVTRQQGGPERTMTTTTTTAIKKIKIVNLHYFASAATRKKNSNENESDSCFFPSSSSVSFSFIRYFWTNARNFFDGIYFSFALLVAQRSSQTWPLDFVKDAQHTHTCDAQHSTYVHSTLIRPRFAMQFFSLAYG